MYHYQIRLVPSSDKLLNSFISFIADKDETAISIAENVIDELLSMTDMNEEFTIQIVSKFEVKL